MNDELALDAYGHMNWTVGNEDWIACFDARRNGTDIEYHVVVDCESGGFVDTIEQRIVPMADAVEHLQHLLFYWADICHDHYGNKAARSGPYFVSVRATRRTTKRWTAYVADLVSRGPCVDTDPCGVCSECQEPGPDPIRDGWIGSDGRP